MPQQEGRAGLPGMGLYTAWTRPAQEDSCSLAGVWGKVWELGGIDWSFCQNSDLEHWMWITKVHTIQPGWGGWRVGSIEWATRRNFLFLILWNLLSLLSVRFVSVYKILQITNSAKEKWNLHFNSHQWSQPKKDRKAKDGGVMGHLGLYKHFFIPRTVSCGCNLNSLLLGHKSLD